MTVMVGLVRSCKKTHPPAPIGQIAARYARPAPEYSQKPKPGSGSGSVLALLEAVGRPFPNGFVIRHHLRNHRGQFLLPILRRRVSAQELRRARSANLRHFLP